MDVLLHEMLVAMILRSLHNFKIYNFLTNKSVYICQSPCSAEDENAWRYTATPSYALMVWTGSPLTLLLMTTIKIRTSTQKEGYEHMHANTYVCIHILNEHKLCFATLLGVPQGTKAYIFVLVRGGKVWGKRPRWSEVIKKLNILEESLNVSD